MTLDKHLRSVLAAAVVVVVIVMSLAILIAPLFSVNRVEPTFTNPGDRPLLVMSPAGRGLELAYAAARCRDDFACDPEESTLDNITLRGTDCCDLV